MFARPEADLEMKRSVIAEHVKRCDLALGRHRNLGQERLNQLLLALAQLVTARPPVKAIEGQWVAGFVRGHRAPSKPAVPGAASPIVTRL
jgi:hypothetical protein